MEDDSKPEEGTTKPEEPSFYDPTPEGSDPSRAPDKKLPPELAGLDRDVLVSGLRKARVQAIKRFGSRPKTDDFMQYVFEKIATTRRWDPAKGNFERHAWLVVKSELSNLAKSKAPDKEIEAYEGYLREVQPAAVPSVEDAIVEAEADDEEGAARRAMAVRELAELRARIAKHELMPQVLACWEDGTEEAGAIAETLGVPVKQVYRALDLIRYHIKKIREDRSNGEGEVS